MPDPWGALEITLEHVGKAVVHGYAKLRAGVEQFRAGVAAAYDTDTIELEFPDGVGPIGHHGRQRLLDAAQFSNPRVIDPEATWPRTEERFEELVVTANAEDQIGIYRLRELDGQPGTQVLHLLPVEAAWLLQVLRRHPRLVRPVEPNITEDWWTQGPGESVDPTVRIEVIISRLARLWTATTDQRLGQLMATLLAQVKPDDAPMPQLYYVKDDDLVRAINGAINQLR